jgi:hypothetical protein
VEKPQEKVKIEPFLAEWKKPFNHMKIKMNWMDYNFKLIHSDLIDQSQNCNITPYELWTAFPQWEGKEDLEIIYK